MIKQRFVTFLTSLILISGCIKAQDLEIIKLETKESEMIFSTQVNEQVRFQYWGDKIANSNDILTKVKYGSRAPEWYPAYGGASASTPALRLTQADGVLTTELVYQSSERKSIDENIEKLIIKLKDKLYPIFVDIELTAYKEENIFSQSVTIYHTGKGIVEVNEMASCMLPINASSYYLTHFSGSWGAEMKLQEEKLEAGTKLIDSKQGISTTHTQSPSFLISLDKKSEENAGKVYAGTLAWSGNYSLSFHVNNSNGLQVIGGMNPFAATYYLEANKHLESPEMLLSYSSKGKGQISRNFHDWVRKYGMVHGNKEHAIVLNSWEGTQFNFDEQKVVEMIDASADLGVEMFVLDDGWFGNKYPRDDQNAGLGDWDFNKKKLPQGINYLAEHAVSKGLRFGLWVELEMVNPASELAMKHPDWIVKSGARSIPQQRYQWVLDLSNPKVQDYVVETFDKIIAMSPHISYIKWDSNRYMTSIGSEYLPKHRQTHFWYEYTKGLYSAYERIKEKHPDLEIQACASGGGRVDVGSLKYHSEFWTSDNTNALDRLIIQHGTSTFFPAIAMASHVSNVPNGQTAMILPMKFRFDVAMAGRLGVELQPKDIPAEELDFVNNAIKLYKDTIRPIVQFGDLYRLTSPYDNSGWASMMHVSKDKKNAVFFLYSLKLHVADRHHAKFEGLDPNKEYEIIEVNRTGKSNSTYANNKVFSGEFLMKYGIPFYIFQPFQSTVLLISEK